MEEHNVPESLDGSLHLVEGSQNNCLNLGPFSGCCSWDGAVLRYGWHVNDTIL